MSDPESPLSHAVEYLCGKASYSKKALDKFVAKYCVFNLKWKFSDEKEQLHISFSDSSSDWYALFKLGENRSISWKRYCYWNSNAVRVQHGERVRRRMNTAPTLLAPALAHRAAVAQEAARLSALDFMQPFIGVVPGELVEDITLNHEHFPEMQFKMIPHLSWYF